jgi:hypothetical protein
MQIADQQDNKIKRSQPSAAPTGFSRTPAGSAEGCDLFGKNHHSATDQTHAILWCAKV